MTDGPLDDTALARALATTAGALLLVLRRSALFDGRALGDAGDRLANGFLITALKAHRPDDAVLSEEEQDCASRLAARRVWIIDPLDGTREYAEGRDDWAVHVALTIDGEPAAGAVALPAHDTTLCTAGCMAAPGRDGAPRMIVSRSRPSPLAEAVARAIGAQILTLGSAGAKAMAVVRGDADIYLHTGGQYEWDSCAPVAVAIKAGLHVSRADGSPLTYNCADPYLPDLLICRPEWADRVIAACRAIAGGIAPMA